VLTMPSGNLTWGKTFRKGGKVVRYGYSGGRKVGLFLYKSARTYSKARYIGKQFSHGYELYRKVPWLAKSKR